MPGDELVGVVAAGGPWRGAAPLAGHVVSQVVLVVGGRAEGCWKGGGGMGGCDCPQENSAMLSRDS